MGGDPNLPAIEAVHACFTELLEGRGDAARSRFDPLTFAAAERLLHAHQALEEAGIPEPGGPTEWAGRTLAHGREFDGLRIGGLLGSGSTGEVYEASELSTGRQVAVKLLPPETSRSAAERLHRETMVLATLEHSGIARLYRSGLLDDASAPRRFIVMELVQGAQTLSAWQSAPSRSVTEIVQLMTSICDAVAYAHGRGVIHCDLKPSNILVDRTGRAVVIDFGIARVLDGDGNPAATVSLLGDRVAGTLAYIAPESLEPGARPDVRADVHALGAILFELLARRTFRQLDGMALHQRLATVATQSAPRLRSIDRSLAGDLDRIVARATARDVADRYASVSQFVDDLRRHLAGQPVLAELQPARERFVRGVVRHRRIVALASLIIGLLIATTVISLGFARAAVREARLANFNAAARAIDDADLLIAKQHLALLGPTDGSIERMLVERAVALQGRVIDSGDWYDVAWAPDGAWFVANGHSGPDTVNSGPILRCFERIATGAYEARWTIPAGESGIHGCAVTADGSKVLDVDAAGYLRIIDAATGAIQVSVPPLRQGGQGLAVAVRSDGLLAVERGSAEFRTLSDPFTLIATAGTEIGTPRALAFAGGSSDLVACVGDGGAMLLDARNGSVVQKLETPAAFQTAVRWSADGTRVFVAGWDRTLRAYVRGSNAPIWSAHGHRDSIWSIELLDDHTVATAAADGTLRFWSTRDGAPIASIPISDDVVWSTAVDPHHGSMLVGSRLGLREVSVEKLRAWSGTPGHAHNLAYGGGATAEPREDGRVALRWTDATDTMLEPPGAGAVDKVALSRDAQLLATLRRDGTISVLSLPNSTVVLATREFASQDLHEPNGITGLAVDSVHRRLIVGSRRDGCVSISIDRGVREWEVRFGSQCTGVAVSTDGSTVYISDRDGQLARARATDGRVEASVRRQRTRASCLAASDDGSRLIVGGADGSLRILDATTLVEQLSISVSSAAMRSVRMTDAGIETIDKLGIRRIR